MEVSTRFQYRERTVSEHVKIEEHRAKLDVDNVPVPSDLAELVELLHKVFAHDFVNVEYVTKLIENYTSNVRDWRKYAKYDPHKYTRNLIDAGNGKFNILLLCWAESQGSSIHDHSNSHCFMKCLDGELCETKFEWPKNEHGEENTEAEMKEIAKTTMKKNEVCYINGKLVFLLFLSVEMSAKF
jgi:cysteine dioxygenase